MRSTFKKKPKYVAFQSRRLPWAYCGVAPPPLENSARQEESHASKECHGVQDFHKFYHAERGLSTVQERPQQAAGGCRSASGELLTKNSKQFVEINATAFSKILKKASLFLFSEDLQSYLCLSVGQNLKGPTTQPCVVQLRLTP